MIASVDRIHAISEELREIKDAHNKAVAILMFLAEGQGDMDLLELNHRVRIRISQRLFEEMGRAMGRIQ